MERLPREMVEMVLLQPELSGLIGLLVQVCRLWRDILTRVKSHKTTQLSEVVQSVPLLQWARDQDCPWDEGTCTLAGKGGHLAVLKWARANRCPWNARLCAA